MTQKHTLPAYTFDGKGINDAADDYRTRIATLNPALNRDQMREHGALIAAAPELLAALKALLPVLDKAQETDNVFGILHNAAMDAEQAALAAIAKAEGRS